MHAPTSLLGLLALLLITSPIAHADTTRSTPILRRKPHREAATDLRINTGKPSLREQCEHLVKNTNLNNLGLHGRQYLSLCLVPVLRAEMKHREGKSIEFRGTTCSILISFSTLIRQEISRDASDIKEYLDAMFAEYTTERDWYCDMGRATTSKVQDKYRALVSNEHFLQRSVALNLFVADHTKLTHSIYDTTLSLLLFGVITSSLEFASRIPVDSDNNLWVLAFLGAIVHALSIDTPILENFKIILPGMNIEDMAAASTKYKGKYFHLLSKLSYPRYKRAVKGITYEKAFFERFAPNDFPLWKLEILDKKMKKRA